MSDRKDAPKNRRAFDKADRRERSQKVLGAAIVAVAVFVLMFGYWWWGNTDLVRDGAPGWSQDGMSLVFMSEVGHAKGDIYIMDADGSGRRQLTDHPAHDSSPALSPDGARIVFESDRDGNPEIYVMDRNGRNLRRLTNDPARDTAPAWSPDGRRIAFASDRDSRASADVYLMDLDGGSLERLTSDMSNWAPQFSHNGRSLAVQINRDVWTIDLASKARRQLTFDPQNGMNPSWSPDDSQIAFVTTRSGRAEIFVARSDGSDARSLVTMAKGSAIDPRWSPLGTHVAFVMLPDSSGPEETTATVPAIYTVEVASGTVTRISN